MSTALYRRYRPDSFADVIGQEHVTNPLMAALQKNRVNHAYLFSGPRGCGKTTSARILARCLNCAKGPTPEPCGACDSCRELGRGGPGSLDVIEIDAASHGGVDDARDLRERATFAPVRDRYKIFIIDEAHMVTSAGFNALLKIVEEPPEHIKFIFATTEPDKVIGTIRSRTHHYPFRLVPPEPLMKYLELLCNQENVPVAPGVLSLVIRAGGGSVRDSLSVLDQLMAGAGPAGLDYELAVSLLGYTHASLLDDVVDAFAASDASTVFSAVDRVVQTGHDPRRFVEDLLERFRDLIIVKAMPESAHTILRGVPEDQIARMQTQAHQLGASELSRAADIANEALTEMTGATSPRLHLELLCARILLPAADQAQRGVAARVDRIERRLSYAGDVPEAPVSADAGATNDGGASPSASGAAGWGGAASGGSGAAQVREMLRAARSGGQAAEPQQSPRPAVPAAAQPAAQSAPAAVQPAPAHAASAPEQPAAASASRQAAPAAAAPQSAASAAASERTAPAASAVMEPAARQAPAAPPSEQPAAQTAPAEQGWNAAPARQDRSVAEPQRQQASPQQPAAPEASADSSRDWGGAWGVVPEPEPEPARTAPASAQRPGDRPDNAGSASPAAGQQQPPAAQPGPAGQAPQNHQRPIAPQDTGQPAGPAAGQQQPRPGNGDRPAGPAQQRPASPQNAVAQAGPNQQPTPPQHPAQPTGPAAGQQPPQDTGQQAGPAAGQQPSQDTGQQAGPPRFGAAGSVEMFRRAWPEIMDVLKSEKKFLWMTVEPNASLAGFDGRTLTVAFSNTGAMTAFSSKQENAGMLRQCIFKVLGTDVQLDITAGGSGAAGESGPKGASRPQPAAGPQHQPATAPFAASNPVNTASDESRASAPAPVDNAPAAATRAPAPVHEQTPADGPASGPAAAVGNGPSGSGSSSGSTAPSGMSAASAQSPAYSAASAPSAASANSPGMPGPAAQSSAPSAASPVSSQSAHTAPSAHSAATAASGQSAHTAPSAQSAASAASGQSAHTAPSAQSAASANWSPSSAPSAASADSAVSMQHAGAAASAPPQAQARPVNLPPPVPGEQPVFAHLANRPPQAAQQPVRPAQPMQTAQPAQPSRPAAGEQEGRAWEPSRSAAPPENEGQVWEPPKASPEAASVPSSPYDDIPFSDDEPPSDEWDGPPPEDPGFGRRMPQAAPARKASSAAPAQPTVSGPAPAAAPPSSTNRPAAAPASPVTPAPVAAPMQPEPGKPMSRYQMLLQQARATEARNRPTEPAQNGQPGGISLSYVEDIPSEDDVAIEDSGLVGRAAIERILGGRLVEERSLDGS
ncbi:DNA polymerase III subunit gamma and tau [Arthrobacter sp. Marseille-P9274]|uniref:DNA polymerase III subunit gamma and tau n=1 Tax=Arthrobacter sp. Marseille-P9274 TaxID=2866572 RepID=UPI0021C7D45A|nr:DNA polymerase III subunit gamma and tau [Arthrobacter sp. Marseille-P9274]